MKKITTILLIITFSLILVLTPKAHAYTLSSTIGQYYNQITATHGTADLLDIDSTSIEYMYYNLGSDLYNRDSPIRAVFSNEITTEELIPISSTFNLLTVEITFINTLGVPIYTHMTYFNGTQSFSYFETNFIIPITQTNNIDEIHVKVSNLLSGYDEDNMHKIMQGLIIGYGSSMIINQTVTAQSYNSGWNDAMKSKVTQIWSIWGNIFSTFMSVFDIFSIHLMGDITIGHMAMVPLVLGLIAFIYSLGGKRGK